MRLRQQKRALRATPRRAAQRTAQRTRVYARSRALVAAPRRLFAAPHSPAPLLVLKITILFSYTRVIVASSTLAALTELIMANRSLLEQAVFERATY